MLIHNDNSDHTELIQTYVDAINESREKINKYLEVAKKIKSKKRKDLLYILCVIPAVLMWIITKNLYCVIIGLTIFLIILCIIDKNNDFEKIKIRWVDFIPFIINMIYSIVLYFDTKFLSNSITIMGFSGDLIYFEYDFSILITNLDNAIYIF